LEFKKGNTSPVPEINKRRKLICKRPAQNKVKKQLSGTYELEVTMTSNIYRADYSNQREIGEGLYEYKIQRDHFNDGTI
jgi:hypothetical protein